MKGRIFPLHVHLKSAAEPIFYDRALDTYQKGSLFCVKYFDSEDDLMVDKYPIIDIFRIRAPYRTIV